jgi:hypothetical protein
LDDLDGIDKTMASGGDALDGPGTLVGDGPEAGGFSVGSVFAGRYKIISGGMAGGMGVVYRCQDLTLEQETALKVIHPRLLRSGDALKRFRQEVSISRKLTHEGIVRVHDIGSHSGMEYFTMEWVTGVSLRDVINKRKKKGQPFSLEEASGIIHSLAEALQHAHRYTIHRDIKPENIMISEDGNSSLKLMDFGIAKMLTVSQFTTTSIQMGTPYYMAPEQKLDTGHVDKRADIYSVGVILFELLTLENTVGPELPSDLNPKLPKEVDDVFRKAVALKPDRRYQEIGEMATALKAVLSQGEKRATTGKEGRKEEQRKQEETRKRQEAEEKAKQEAEVRRRREEEESRQRQTEGEQAARRREDEENRRLKEGGKTNKTVWVVGLILIAAVIGFAISQIKPAPAPASAPAPAPAPAAPAIPTAPAPAPAAPFAPAVSAWGQKQTETLQSGFNSVLDKLTPGRDDYFESNSLVVNSVDGSAPVNGAYLRKNLTFRHAAWDVSFKPSGCTQDEFYIQLRAAGRDLFQLGIRVKNNRFDAFVWQYNQSNYVVERNSFASFDSRFHTFEVKRSPDGSWDLLWDGSSIGTGVASANARIDEIKFYGSCSSPKVVRSFRLSE